MKRFQLLVIVAAITAAAIWWGFYRSRHTSSAAVISLLPKDTLLFVHLPDINRSRADFRRTDLYQIWSEPAVQDFLQKPRTRIPADDHLGQALQDCESLQMKDAFLALIALQDGASKIVGGFRFGGDSVAAEKIVANWKAKWLGETASDLEMFEHRNDQIQAHTTAGGRLFTARHGHWYLAANDIDQLKLLLDWVDRRMDAQTSLAADDLFAAAAKHMPSIYAAFGFARLNQFVEKLVPSRKAGENKPDDQTAAIRQIRSLSAATSFDGGKIRDAIFVGMPRLPEEGKLTRASLPIATKDTFLYATGLMSLPQSFSDSQPALGWLGGVQDVIAALSNSGITYESWKSAFGPEVSWIGNWPSNAHWPALFVSVPVRNPAKAREIFATITSADANAAPWTQQEKDGVQYFSTRASLPFFALSPTIGLSDQILIAGADTRTVEAAMQRIANGDSELAVSKTFRAAERAVPPAQQLFAYIDPALIYTGIDSTVRPLLFFLPMMADTIDQGKWPRPETITQHLTPIVMSQRYDGDGYIAESVGPITMSQTLVGIGGLGSAAALLYRKQTGGSITPPITTSIAPASPSPASPTASPENSPN